MKKILLASLASTLALLIWGMLFWGILYEPTKTFKSEVLDESILNSLVSNDVKTGTYFYPWPRNTKETAKVWLEKHKEGPFFKLSYVREGVNPQAPIKFLFGFIHNFITCLLASLILFLALPSLKSFIKRFLIVFCAGLMGTIYIQLGDPIWFHLPWDYPLGVLLYELVSWAILGLILGRMIKPTVPV